MSAIRAFALEPLDTLLFRDGSPFDQSDEGLIETRSIFPPFPSVVAGALRARLAREMGWGGRGEWTDDFKRYLGSGAFNAGQSRFGPPIILRAHANPSESLLDEPEYRPLFPCPAAIYGDPEKKELVLALPQPQTRRAWWCGLYEWAFPRGRSSGDIATDLDLRPGQSFSIRRAEYESLEDWLITGDGLKTFLQGKVPIFSQCLYSRSPLVTHQNRAGLLRNYATHGAEPGMLYSASHVRLQQQRVRASGKVGKVAIGVAASLPSELSIPAGAIVPLGSMGKAASCSPLAPATLDLNSLSIGADKIIRHRGYLHYSLVLISPAGELQLPGGHEVVSAVMRKPVAFSGWDAAQRAPAPMRRYYASGTTWYLRFKGKVHELQEVFDDLQQNGISEVGASVGFGAVVIGTWDYPRDTKP